MHIRDYRTDDYDQLISLWQLTHLPAKPEGRDAPAQIDRQIASGCVFLLVAEQDGAIVGSCLGSHDSRKGYVNHLAVAPRYQRSPLGVAVRLLEATEERFQLLGLEYFAALIEGYNATSRRFFASVGYVRSEGMTYYTKRLRPEA